MKPSLLLPLNARVSGFRFALSLALCTVVLATVPRLSASAAPAFTDTYFVSDYLATTVASIDAAGVIAQIETDAFGAPLAAGQPAVRYTGKPYDEDMGAYVFPFRNYRPDEARWMTQDPSGFPDGPNYYHYVANPICLVDSLGLSPTLSATNKTVNAGMLELDFVDIPSITTNGDSFRATKKAQWTLTGQAANGWIVQEIVQSDSVGIANHYLEAWQVIYSVESEPIMIGGRNNVDAPYDQWLFGGTVSNSGDYVIDMAKAQFFSDDAVAYSNNPIYNFGSYSGWANDVGLAGQLWSLNLMTNSTPDFWLNRNQSNDLEHYMHVSGNGSGNQLHLNSILNGEE